MLKLALLAKENMILDTQFSPQPEQVQILLEPIYKVTVQESSAYSECERLARTVQSRTNWETRCQLQLEIGIMCGDKPWSQKAVSVI